MLHKLRLYNKTLLIAGPLENSSVYVHTTREEFENAALFLRLGLPSSLIHHQNSFLKTLFKL